jgi:putative ABC transport system permease protein
MWNGEPTSKIYLPYIVNEAARYNVWLTRMALHQNVALRMTRGHPADLDAVRRAVAEVTDGMPIEQVRWMTTAMTESSGGTPGFTVLLSFAAAVALLLAAVGVFGTVSFTVSQRTHEIGIRIALGASRGAVMRLVLSGALWVGAAGVLTGSVAAFWMSRLIASELFPGVSPRDPLVFAAVAFLLVSIVLIATWIPAQRASSVDPAVALRAD